MSEAIDRRQPVVAACFARRRACYPLFTAFPVPLFNHSFGRYYMKENQTLQKKRKILLRRKRRQPLCGRITP
jgi:hypothetical protein